MLVGTRRRGFSSSAQRNGADGCRSDKGLVLFGFFTVTVRFFHILQLVVGRKGSASAIELRQRKGLFALQGISKSWKVVC
jgi:hypothetical protein